MTWAPDYVTAAQLKSYLNIQHDNDDLWLANWATAVSRNVDDFCNRQFGQTALESRTYIPQWDHNELRSYMDIDDLYDITGFTLTDSSSHLITNYKLEPLNSIAKGKPYTRVSIPFANNGNGIGWNFFGFTSADCNIVAMGKWGWNSVPAAIPTATYIQASRLSARRNSPFGVAGSPSDGSEIRLLAQLDPDFRTTLKPYIRNWFVR